MESTDITVQNIEKVEALFPNCMLETVDANGNYNKVMNFNLLKQMFRDEVLDGMKLMHLIQRLKLFNMLIGGNLYD